MERNLYSPPTAPVADPLETHLQRAERPPEVGWAMWLLWMSFLISTLAVFQPFFLRTSLVFAALTIGTPRAIVAWILFSIGRGRQWARITYGVLFVFGIAYQAFLWKARLVNFHGKFSQSDVLTAAEDLLRLAGICLLFSRRANLWFRAPDRPVEISREPLSQPPGNSNPA
jgi:hypothetical protein